MAALVVLVLQVMAAIPAVAVCLGLRQVIPEDLANFLGILVWFAVFSLLVDWLGE